MVSGVMIYWGITTVLMKHALSYMSSVTYIMLRFTIAAVIVLVLFGRDLYRNRSPRLFLHGMLLGLFEVIPMECMTLAMYFTSASNSVFIAQLSFFFVPLFECVIRRQLPGKRLVRTVFLLLFGLVVFSNVLFTGLNAGDMISVVSALSAAVNLLLLKRFAEEDSSRLLGVLQIVFGAAFALVVWAFYPGTMEVCRESVEILFFTGVIGSAAGFVLVAMGQARTSAPNAAFLSLLQPVFGMIGAYLIADSYGNIEEITGYKIAGAAIIIGSLIMYLKGNDSSGKKL